MPRGNRRSFSNRMCCAFQPCEVEQFASSTEPLLEIVSIERLTVKSIRKLRRNLTNQSKHVDREQGGNQSRILRVFPPLSSLPYFSPCFTPFSVCAFSVAWQRLHIFLRLTSLSSLAPRFASAPYFSWSFDHLLGSFTFAAFQR